MIIYSTQIHALGSPKYQLRCPLLVTISEHKDDTGWQEIVASIPEFGLYGSAVSEDLALLKLKDEIVSTYECLARLSPGLGPTNPDKLGRLMYCCLEAMRAVIMEANG